MNEKYKWQKGEDERRESRRPQKKVQQTKLNRRTKKGAIQDRIYLLLRKDYLNDHPVCECGKPGCVGIATEIHHKKGRGVWLTVVDFFLAVCWKCHKWIEAHPEEARKFGYTVDRVEASTKKILYKKQQK